MRLLQMSAAGGMLILAAALVRALLFSRLPKRSFAVLWAMALLRLLVPVTLPSPVSVHRLLPQPTTAKGGVLATVGFPWEAVLWVAGAALCALVFAVSYIKSRRAFAGAVPVTDEGVSRMVREQCGLRKIAVRVGGCRAPLTYGLLRPVILLPEGMNLRDEALLRVVLNHELMHIRRLDGPFKLLLAAALCLHWFNPLVWLLFFLCNKDLEFACDEAVLGKLGEAQRGMYARALIRMEEAKSGNWVLYSGFGANAAEERIGAIMKFKKRSVAMTAASAVMVLGVTAVFATSAPAVLPTVAVEQDGGYQTIQNGEDLQGLLGDGYKQVGLSVKKGNAYINGQLAVAVQVAGVEGKTHYTLWSEEEGGMMSVHITPVQEGADPTVETYLFKAF